MRRPTVGAPEDSQAQSAGRLEGTWIETDVGLPARVVLGKTVTAPPQTVADAVIAPMEVHDTVSEAPPATVAPSG
jgi:hypothetical protein